MTGSSVARRFSVRALTLAAVVASTLSLAACAQNSAGLSAEDSAAFAEAYTQLTDGAITVREYGLVVQKIANGYPAEQAQQFTSCADRMAQATDVQPYKDAAEGMGSAIGGGDLAAGRESLEEATGKINDALGALPEVGSSLEACRSLLLGQ